MDDPYDQMRRNRLVEPRTRARSISPHRPLSQRDPRSQSVARNERKERKGSIEGTSSRSEWFDKEGSGSFGEEATGRRQRASFAGAPCTGGGRVARGGGGGEPRGCSRSSRADDGRPKIGPDPEKGEGNEERLGENGGGW